MGEHGRAKHGGARRLGRRGAAFQPVEQGGVGRGQAVPDFLDVVRRDGLAVIGGEFGERGFGQAGGGAGPQRAGDEFEQRVADIRAGGIEPGGEQRGQFGFGAGAQGGDDRGEAGGRGFGAGLPDEGDGFCEVADEIIGEGEEGGVGAGFGDAADEAGFGGGEGELAGEGGECPAAVGVGFGGEKTAQEGDLGETAGGEGETVEEGGEGNHQGGSAPLDPRLGPKGPRPRASPLRSPTVRDRNRRGSRGASPLALPKPVAELPRVIVINNLIIQRQLKGLLRPRHVIGKRRQLVVAENRHPGRIKDSRAGG